MIDPNCRPEAVTDREAYLARLYRILRRADVVKVSVEDLAYLAPGVPARPRPRTCSARGPHSSWSPTGPAPPGPCCPGRR